MRCSASRQLWVLLLASGAGTFVAAGPVLEQRAAMRISVKIIERCMSSSPSAHLTGTQTGKPALESSVSVSCTPGTPHHYSTRFDAETVSNPAQPGMPATSQNKSVQTAVEFTTSEIDASTRVFTASKVQQPHGDASHASQGGDQTYMRFSVVY